MRNILALSLLTASFAIAQQAPNSAFQHPHGTLHFNTKIGSFRFLGTQDNESAKRIPAEGKVQIAFSGTVLLNNLVGKVTTTGKIRKEYDAKGRQVYFGKGTMVVDGTFWAMQFFGTDLTGSWRGWGQARLFGEFDDKLNTGNFWYDVDPTKQYWSPYGTTIAVPRPGGGPVVPKEKKPGGN